MYQRGSPINSAVALFTDISIGVARGRCIRYVGHRRSIRSAGLSLLVVRLGERVMSVVAVDCAATLPLLLWVLGVVRGWICGPIIVFRCLPVRAV
jgi:hypothetical protein